MFTNLAQEKQQSKQSELDAKKDAKEAREERKKLLEQIEDLTNERDRKKQLALQAVAARGQIKQHLDEAVLQVEIMKKEKLVLL